jgi:hypothetical protein
MFHFSPRVFVQLSIAGAVMLGAATQVQAQAILATTSTSSKPSKSNQKAWHDSMPSKVMSTQIHEGMFTIDGMVAKVKLNYTVEKVGYMYFFVPGMGTAIVSLSPMPDSIKVKDAFDGHKLSFTAAGHRFELTSTSELLGKYDAYVHFDASTTALARTPSFGFGNTMQSPYVWPLAKPASLDKEAHLVQPPPMPATAMPRVMEEDESSATSKSKGVSPLKDRPDMPQ